MNMGRGREPKVHWTQTESHIFLRVELIEDLTEDPDISIEEEELEFSARANETSYEFLMEFFLPIKAQESSYERKGREIRIKLPKKEKDWWPRLLYESQEYSWLKTAEDETLEISTADLLRNKYPGVYTDLRRRELGFVSESKRKIYLFTYNLFMFCGFLYVFAVLNIRYARFGEDFLPLAYSSVGNPLKVLHLLMFLEVLHPIFGYTKSSAAGSLLHVGGRNFILLGLVSTESRIQEKPVIYYSFIIYCLNELFKYPYYLLRTYDVQQGFITWLRYTLWIPIHPAAFICEGVILLRSIPYFEETRRFTISLPNPYNFTFHFPTLLRLYLLFVFFPTLYATMQNMYQLRCKKLGIRQHKKNKKGGSLF